MKYLYYRLLENAKKDGKEKIVKSCNNDLNEIFEYIKSKSKNDFKDNLKVEQNELKQNTKKIKNRKLKALKKRNKTWIYLFIL